MNFYQCYRTIYKGNFSDETEKICLQNIKDTGHVVVVKHSNGTRHYYSGLAFLGDVKEDYCNGPLGAIEEIYEVVPFETFKVDSKGKVYNREFLFDKYKEIWNEVE